MISHVAVCNDKGDTVSSVLDGALALLGIALLSQRPISFSNPPSPCYGLISSVLGREHPLYYSMSYKLHHYADDNYNT